MEIRELALSELNALLDLYTHMHDADAPLPDRERVETLWQEIQASPYFKYFGAFVTNKLVSSCTLSIIPNLTRGCRPYGLIENVVSHSDFRQRGLGRALLKHTLAYAWGCNCYKVMLLTGRKNEAVYRFYEGAGFDRNAKQAFIAKPAPPQSDHSKLWNYRSCCGFLRKDG